MTKPKKENNISHFTIDSYRSLISSPDSNSNKKSDENFFELYQLKQITENIKKDEMQPYRMKFNMVALYTAGKMKNKIGFDDFDCSKYSLKFLPYEQIQSWKIEQKIDGYTCYFDDLFFNSYLNADFQLNQSPLFQIETPVVLQLNRNNYQEILSLFTKIEQLFLEDYLVNQKIIRNYLLIIFEIAEQAFYKHDAIRLSKKSISGETVTKYKQLLQNHYKTIIKYNSIERKPVSYFAEKLNIHANYLNECVKKEYGKTANDLLLEKILTEAKILLITTSYTVDQISDILDFSSASYFNQFFKKFTNSTPLQFRKEKSI
ncbi:helix-turn-helix domain-containing protein [Soonwooa sp.]|uniref:helix-turn-helix domain-containing protein n=1 Tax=Soonwooa sp. TaxID=1938592 RepID=UPI0026245879|nr:helix-turn-helix domain-containing protein [Soonwooa sp.]